MNVVPESSPVFTSCRDLYRCVRNSNCGDRLPILTPEIKSILEDKAILEDQINNSQKVNTAPCQDQD